MAAPFAQTHVNALALTAAPGPFESASQEDLFLDLARTLQADSGVVSRVVCTRSKRDQREIARVLGHLPLVREGRRERRAAPRAAGAEDAWGAAAAPPPAAAEAPAAAGPPRQQSAGGEGGRRREGAPPQSARGPCARSAAPYRAPRVPLAEPAAAAAASRQAGREKAAAARRAKSARLARKEAGRTAAQQEAAEPGRPEAVDGLPPPATARRVTPLPAAADGVRAQGMLATPPQERPVSAGLPCRVVAEASHGAAAPSRPAAPRDGSHGEVLRRPASAALRASAAATAAASPPAPAEPALPVGPDRPKSALASQAPWAAGATRLLPGGAKPDPAFQTAAFLRKKAMEDDAGSQARADLAALGIVAERETPDKILFKMYMRTGGSTYGRMNKEAESRLPAGGRSPLAMTEVLKSEALEEVKKAQLVPRAQEGDHLDKWEMGTLAEVCRAIKHYDEVARGPITENMRQYSSRGYREEFGRKAFVRNPPWAFG